MQVAADKMFRLTYERGTAAEFEVKRSGRPTGYLNGNAADLS